MIFFESRFYLIVKYLFWGTLFGLVLGYILFSGILFPWNYVPLPNNATPEMIFTKFEKDERQDKGLMVSTQEGELYYYPLTSYKVRLREWELVDSQVLVDGFWGYYDGSDLFCHQDFDNYFISRMPPGKVEKEVKCTVWGGELSSLYRLVLLDNGELWLWSINGALLAWLNHGIVMIISMIGSLIVGLLVAWKKKRTAN